MDRWTTTACAGVVPLVARAAGRSSTPGFALELVRAAEGEDSIGLESHGGMLRVVSLGKHRLPANAKGELTLRFSDVPGTSITSAANLFRKGLPANLFAGKIVLVGLTAGGATDEISTPRQASTYGVFMQAQAVDAILRGAGLVRPDWAWPAEVVLGVLVILGALAVVPRLGLRAIGALLGLLFVAAVGASWAAFLGGQLLDPIPVAGPALATAAAMIALMSVESGRAQTRLKAALDLERLSAAKTAGELAAASEIQSGMLLPREALRRVSDAVEIRWRCCSRPRASAETSMMRSG